MATTKKTVKKKQPAKKLPVASSVHKPQAVSAAPKKITFTLTLGFVLLCMIFLILAIVKY